ncbi:MAG: glycine C-acetyltransferase [bacterium]|nr:glycine C-acetyltransferase [bacterium]
MYASEFQQRLSGELESIREQGLLKEERYLLGAQGVEIEVASGKVLNFCSNDYLGLANHPEVITAAQRGMNMHGYGMASVRFICGTQEIHRELELSLARLLGKPEAILFPSCFDANAAVFEVLLGAEDVVIADRLVHASLIDGMRLCKAQQDTYKNANMAHLRSKLEQWRGRARTMLVVSDGVFSMDGILAPVDKLAALCTEFGALLLIDDSHATGLIGAGGRGTHEHFGVLDCVDIVTTTLGKALGGASGGVAAGPAEVVELLRNRARPYLFSNSVPPAVVHGALKAIELVNSGVELRERLTETSRSFREQMEAADFSIVPGETPIVPVMLGDARIAGEMARRLLDEGIYVVGFSHPVVPLSKARIRVQLSAQHKPQHIERCVTAFLKVRREMF